MHYKFTSLPFNIDNNKILATILFFAFVIIFETYIFEYFKVRIVGSHSLGLFMCVFSVCSVFYQRRRALYTKNFKHCAIEKYGIFYKINRKTLVPKSLF